MPGPERLLRAIAVAALGGAALAGLAWYTVSSQQASCEACVSYRGREACRTASAASLEEAQRQAQATACALVTAGVTEDLECQRSRPRAIRCE